MELTKPRDHSASVAAPAIGTTNVPRPPSDGTDFSTNNQPAGEFMIPMPPPHNQQFPLTHHPAQITPITPSSDPSVFPSSDTPMSTPTANKRPLGMSPGSGPGLTRRKTFKLPKSRFGEASLPVDIDTMGTYAASPLANNNFGPHLFQSPRSSRCNSGINTPRSAASVSPMSPFSNSARKETVSKDGYTPDEREIYERVTAQLSERKQPTISCKLTFEIFIFLAILGCLIASFASDKMKNHVVFGLKVWKLFVLLMSIFSGMLITQWVVHMVVFFIEWKYMLQKNLLYYTHGLKSSVAVFLWISVVLCTWVALFKPDLDDQYKSHGTRKFLDILTWSNVSLLVGSFLWLVKESLLKVLASSFHLTRFFDRIQESIFHHYTLQTLSGRPMLELVRRASVLNQDQSSNSVVFDVGGGGDKGKVTLAEKMKSHTKKKKVVDLAKLHRMKKDKVPSYTMQLLVDVVSNSGLSTVSGMVSEDMVQGGVNLDDDEISTEEHAIVTAVKIFENIIQHRDETEQHEYLERDDLLKFMIEEGVDLLLTSLEVDEKGQISLRAFCTWVVRVFKERVQLQHALNDNKTAIKQLNKLVSFILVIIVFVIWLLLTEIMTTKLLLFFSSQLLVAGFIFGNTCKTIFEAIIFVFVMHPFDVGDRCVIDGTMMIVEEMNILTTVFLKVDKEKVYYPNQVLVTKPISNFYRSPENQGDWVEFSIDFKTPVAKIGELKERIKTYLVENPHFWRPDHFVIVREIENVNKLKMALFANHTMNFQDFPEKSKRKSELILHVKKIFEDLNIKYHLLPQEVLLNNVSPSALDPLNMR